MDVAIGSPKSLYLVLALKKTTDSSNSNTGQPKVHAEIDETEFFSVYDPSPRNGSTSDDDEPSKIDIENNELGGAGSSVRAIDDKENVVKGTLPYNSTPPMTICYPPGGRDSLDIYHEQRFFQRITGLNQIAKK
jgi:hypothetical protein